jgi:hypothetical protein
MRAPQIVIGIVAALALAGAGFVAGMTVAQARTPAADRVTPAASASPSRGAAGAGARQGGGQAAGLAPTSGRVIAVNEGSITVAVRPFGQFGQGGAQASASPDPTSQIILVGAQTRILKTTETDIKLGDIKVNDQVTVVGTTDSAGLLSANAIVVGGVNVLGQLLGTGTGNPALGGGRPGASASPSGRP